MCLPVCKFFCLPVCLPAWQSARQAGWREASFSGQSVIEFVYQKLAETVRGGGIRNLLTLNEVSQSVSQSVDRLIGQSVSQSASVRASQGHVCLWRWTVLRGDVQGSGVGGGGRVFVHWFCEGTSLLMGFQSLSTCTLQQY